MKGPSKPSVPALHAELVAVLGLPFTIAESATTRPENPALDGEWIGAFGHAVLGPVIVSSCEAEFRGSEGSSADRHGTATLSVVRWKNARIVFTKRYENGAIVHHRGQLVGDTLLGYWESTGVLPRRGLFALRRAEHVAPHERDNIRRAAVINRRTFFFFTLPFVALVSVLFAARHHLPSPGYLVLFLACFIVLAVMGHQVLPHNRLLARARSTFGPNVGARRDEAASP